MIPRHWRMGLRERIGQWSPMYLLFVAERDTGRDLQAQVATLTEERDRARLIATALEDELESEWAEGDAFLRSLGERGSA